MMQTARGMLRERLEAAKNQPRDTAVRAHVQPGKNAAKQVRKLEKKLGTLPLSLRAFYEVVGSIDLMGQHSSLTPRKGPISPDPLVVFSIEDALAYAEGGEKTTSRVISSSRRMRFTRRARAAASLMKSQFRMNVPMENCSTSGTGFFSSSICGWRFASAGFRDMRAMIGMCHRKLRVYGRVCWSFDFRNGEGLGIGAAPPTQL
jgi:hypothetical protein